MTFSLFSGALPSLLGYTIYHVRMGSINTFFSILSFVLSFGATIPYVIDIIKGRARLARSTRILLLLLISVTLVVQSREFTSGVLLLTIGELATQVVLFILSIKHGMGGLTRLDIASYAGFIISLSAYLLTRNAALSLTLLVVTGFIAFLPTLVKIWRDPTSDTWIVFVVGGMTAAAASLLAHSTNSYIELVFPTYIFIANALAALPILLYKKRSRGRNTL